MAITLTTEKQTLGNTQTVGEGSLYYYFYARYSKTGATTANIIVEVTAYGTANGTASSSGSTFSCTLNGTTKTVRCSFSWPKWGESGVSGTLTFPVTYDTTSGTWANKSISCSISGGSGTWSTGQGIGNCSGRSAVTNTVTLPAIDPSPTASISSISIRASGYEGEIVAGYTLLTATMSVTKVRTASLSWTGAGITSSATLSPTYSTSEATITYNLTTAVPASATNYTLTFTLSYGNNTASGTATKTASVKGYALPVLGQSSYVSRCEGNGKASPNGSFGKIYLATCTVTPITSTNPNKLITDGVAVDSGGGYITVSNIKYTHGMHPYSASSGTTLTFRVGTDTGYISSDDLAYFNGRYTDTSGTHNGTKLLFGSTDGGDDVGTRYVTNVSVVTENHITTATITLNSSITVTTSTYVSIGAVDSGYLTLSPYERTCIFPLSPISQGNVRVTLRDSFGDSLSPKLTNYIYLVVPKSIMALSLYQEGDAVGIAVGRMATESGLWCYENFYLKSSTQGSGKIFHIQVDDNGNITASEV